MIRSNLLKSTLNFAPFILSLLILGLALFDFGFDQSSIQNHYLRLLYFLFFSLEFIFVLIRYRSTNRPGRKVWIFDTFLLITIFLTIATLAGWWNLSSFFDSAYWGTLVTVMILFREFVPIDYKRKVLNPAQIFMISFLFLIFAGAFVLMLPLATFTGISFIDALFTSTSAEIGRAHV